MRKQCVTMLKAAMHRTPKAAPEGRKSYDDRHQAEWAQWQSNPLDSVNAIFSDASINAADEKAAWHLLGEVLDVHRLGPQVTGYKPDCVSKFTERIKKIEQAIADYAIVRLNAVERKGMHELAASPERYVKRKIDNLWNNFRKARLEEERQALKKAAEDVNKGSTADAGEGGDSGKAKPSTKKTGAAALKRMKAPAKKQQTARAPVSEAGDEAEEAERLAGADSTNNGALRGSQNKRKRDDVPGLDFSNVSSSLYFQQGDNDSSEEADE